MQNRGKTERGKYPARYVLFEVLEEWPGQQSVVFTEYDDTITRRLVERIMVVDAGTIRVKLRDADVEIEGYLSQLQTNRRKSSKSCITVAAQRL